MTCVRREGEPHDRLTRLCAARCGGLQLHGYDDDTDAVVDLLVHLQAIFKSQGRELLLAPLRGGAMS